MEEILKCDTCKVEFHQSFLSAHVEAYHVEMRKEDMILLSCLSCSFTADTLHKNSMVQHCLVTGHQIQDIETQFNSYLLMERVRIDDILKISYSILSSNLQPFQREKTSEEEKKRDESPKIPFRRKRKMSPTFVAERTENKENSMTLNPLGSESFVNRREGDSQDEIIIKEEVLDNSTVTKSFGSNTPVKMPCKKCKKEITIAKCKSHTLQYAVGHALLHYPDMKLFRCLLCGNETKHKSHHRNHLKKHGNITINTENTKNIGTQDKKDAIRDFVLTNFPHLIWNKNLDVLKYS